MVGLFSERYGLIGINEDYTASFRSAIVTSFFNQYTSLEEAELFYRLKDVMDVFGIDQKPQVNDLASLKSNKEQTIAYFQKCQWYHLFDFIEYVLMIDAEKSKALEGKYDRVFRMHGCKYRIVDGKTVPIVDDIEIQEINRAMKTGVVSTDKAFSEALSLLSVKTNPDYNAVVAKASNALEAMVIAIAGSWLTREYIRQSNRCHYK